MSSQALFGLALIGGALWWFFRTDPAARLALQDQLSRLGIGPVPLPTAQQSYREQQEALQRAAQTSQMQASTVHAATGIVEDIVPGDQSGITGLIEAGANLLIYRLRGGWEGVVGNDLRDAFFNQFIQLYYPGAGSEMQQPALARALGELGLTGPEADRYIVTLYQADSDGEMKIAIRNIANAFASRGITIAVPPGY